MIGVFDSGAGGAFALSELRRLSPLADVAFYADRENAPYGAKSPEELIRLVERDVERLLSVGCESVVMACCTASAVHGLISPPLREAAAPIIEPTAKRAARITKNKKIGILSTEATRKSGAFVRALYKYSPNAETVSVAAPELVAMAERGVNDGNISSKDESVIEKILFPFKKSGVDTVILGCTHFAYFEREIKKILNAEAVNSARVCAQIASRLAGEGSGITLYL